MASRDVLSNSNSTSRSSTSSSTIRSAIDSIASRKRPQSEAPADDADGRQVKRNAPGPVESPEPYRALYEAALREVAELRAEVAALRAITATRKFP